MQIARPLDVDEAQAGAQLQLAAGARA